MWELESQCSDTLGAEYTERQSLALLVFLWMVSDS